MKNSRFWTWIALLGGLLTVIDSAHELISGKKEEEKEV